MNVCDAQDHATEAEYLGCATCNPPPQPSPLVTDLRTLVAEWDRKSRRERAFAADVESRNGFVIGAAARARADELAAVATSVRALLVKHGLPVVAPVADADELIDRD